MNNNSPIKLSGQRIIHTRSELLWDRLIDPDFLAASLGNLDNWQIDQTPHQFTADVKVPWGGKLVIFPTQIRWRDLVKPERATMNLRGQTSKSGFDAHTSMHLRPQGEHNTLLEWNLEAILSGGLAQLPRGFVKSGLLLATNQMLARVDKFFLQHESQH